MAKFSAAYKQAVLQQRLPAGAKLIAWVDRHPSDDPNDTNLLPLAVLRMAIGNEVAWTGSSMRSLPPNWRDGGRGRPLAIEYVEGGDSSPSPETDYREYIAPLIGPSGVSQAEAARRTGLSQGKISEWLAGTRDISLSDQLRLAEALGCRVTWPRVEPPKING